MFRGPEECPSQKTHRERRFDGERILTKTPALVAIAELGRRRLLGSVA